MTVAGPAAFIGLLTPYFVRRFGGYDQRVVLPASFFFGGGVLAISDMVARSFMKIVFDSATEFPTGIITALVGGSLFIWLLFSRK